MTNERSVCLSNAHLIRSAVHAPELAHVYIVGNRITSIVPASEAIQPADEQIDCSSSVVVPGFSNMHAHCRPGRAFSDGEPVPIWHQRVDDVARNMTREDAVNGALVAYGELLLAGVTSSLMMTRYFDEAAKAAQMLGARSAVVPLAGDGGGAQNGALDHLDESLALLDERVNNEKDPVQLWPGFDSPLTTSIEGMTSVARVAERLGTGLHAHMAETAYEVDTFRAKRGAEECDVFRDVGLLRERAVIAHCNWLESKDIENFAAAGASVVHNPTSNMKFASGVCDVGSLVEAGVNVALGTDGMLSNFTLNMFDAMRGAAMLHRIHNRDASLMPSSQVLAMATENGAKLFGPRIGRIEEGWIADVTVIDMSDLHFQPYRRTVEADRDLLNLLVWCARPSDVSHVLCDGTIVVSNRRLVNVSEKQIRAGALSTDERLRPAGGPARSG